MKTISKIIIGIFIFLVLFTIIIKYPFEEQSNFKLDDNVLVFYSQGLGIAGRSDIEILNNGSIVRVKTYINKPWEFEQIDKLNSEELNRLKIAIDNNQFTISKISLLDKWIRENRSDFVWDGDNSIEIWINKNGQVIKIQLNGVIWDIIKK